MDKKSRSEIKSRRKSSKEERRMYEDVVLDCMDVKKTRVKNTAIPKGRLKDYVMVSEDLIGTVIGPDGCNIKLAKKVRGVLDIKHLNCTEGHKFNIYANNERALTKARSFLELQKGSLMIPTAYAGRIIGKHGKNLNDIVAKSSVHRIVRRKVNEGVYRDIIGNLEAIEQAKRLLSSHLDKLKAKDALKETWLDLKLQKESIFIPSMYAGLIIGKNGKNLNEVVSNSSVQKIFSHQVNEGVNLDIIGKPEAVEHAKRLINSHLEKRKRKKPKAAPNVGQLEKDSCKKHPEYLEQTIETSFKSKDVDEEPDSVQTVPEPNNKICK